MSTPSKLTKDSASKIIGAIHVGCVLDTAVLSAGIARSTLGKWLRRGVTDLNNGKRTIAAKFKNDFDAAVAVAQVSVTKVIHKAAIGTKAVEATEETKAVEAVKPDWKAAAWLAERRWPEIYARRQILSLTRDDGVVTNTILDLERLDDSELRVMRELIKKAGTHPPKEDKKAKAKAAKESAEASVH